MGAGTKAEWAIRCSTLADFSMCIRGGADPGFLRVIVRADRRVRQLRFQSEMGERCDMLLPTVSNDILGVTFFAALLPWETSLISLQGLDADDHVLPP
jgi:hypothetical protein